MSLGKRPTQYKGVLPANPPNVIIATRAPVTGTDKAFVEGDIWLDTNGQTSYQFIAEGATWIALGTGASGGVVTLTGDSGGPIAPVGGNIDILGTTDEIEVTGTAGTLTFTLPAAITAPGSLTTTTSLEATTTVTAGTGITATTGNITATLGDVVINGAAKQLQVHGGAATDFIGTATLTNGTVTVLNTNIAATDRIFVTRSAVNASTALGVFKVVKTAATNFVITACKPTDGTTETGDASTVEYFIVRQV